MDTARTPTPMDAVAERWLDTLLELQPEWHVELGRPGREGEYADLSPDGHGSAADAARATLAEVRTTEVRDDVDRVTRAELERTLGLAVELHEAGEWQRDLNVIASPVQGVRDIFDLMATDTPDDWHHVALRLDRVEGALAGYTASLRAGIRSGRTPAVRQVREVLTQVRKLTAPDNFFEQLAARGPEAQRAALASAAARAAAAYADLAEFLQDELAPRARAEDAVGREAYALASRGFVGVEVDLDETYAWGVEELARMVAEQEEIADRILPGATVPEAIAHLSADPSMQLHGTEALRAWMQEVSDRAVAELGEHHFDIPAPVRRLECMIAPTQEGGIYYTPPSEDFSRAGRMWWSVPEGVTAFDTWRELTTVYHEGVPGHHLQLGLAMTGRDRLNAWRRINWNSGHGEGWALYAERLMADLGHLDAPADRLGMLDGQRQRAARVVADIGVHLGLPKPDGSGPWRGDDVLPFMLEHMNMDERVVRFEANRYLGWAGQAPSYKIGQRHWEQLRDDWTARHGQDLKRFHAEALAVGSVGLGTLRDTLLP
ncbi:hypothetical protein HMPREF0063_11607 [Aeromicrobium marinum DSM 15272]|uniref:DUF885 domain-containing protein n=1 Tax=Aeromicrobium marinum DSM 15272 TaxID=585531 RepID=E2SC48_9ACTN|nr:DUF885 domain-containing protein [Aeromicrobium marinum]EFQ83334.1 hypothetical protein HMPREF0063_11607 [Aeromicrobium marinum DSM 15272]